MVFSAAEANQVRNLPRGKMLERRIRLRSFNPEDGKYAEAVEPLRDYFTPEAEWRAFAKVQHALIQTRHEYGQATAAQVREVGRALKKIDPLNMAMLEEHKDIKHDQLAVLEELGRHIKPETKALLHPGTTSYDIVDTARAHLLREAWFKVMRPVIANVIRKYADLAEENMDIIQVGRTHVQHTSPVVMGKTFSDYARRMAEALAHTDAAVNGMRGKVSGIVGTGASVEMVIGKGKAEAFEREVLKKLDLKPDETATQVTSKESLVRVGNGIATLMSLLADSAGNIRLLHSSEIKEVVSSDTSGRLGGSSADAGKDNPINYENVEGKLPVVLGGQFVLNAMMQTDFQRDLRSSVQGRYQPVGMLTQTFESFRRMEKALKTLKPHPDNIALHLQTVRKSPTEAMTAILRGEQGWVHPEFGVGHDFVKAMAKKARSEKRGLLDVSLDDAHFARLFATLHPDKQAILRGELEKYTGHSVPRAIRNIAFARRIANLRTPTVAA